jgi:hypothetical protein
VTHGPNGFAHRPSVLSADFARLGDEVRDVIAAGADLIHFDVMDNHYVPNLTVGPIVCEALRSICTVPIDVHLMVKPVDRIVPDFAKAGAAIISFHPEASEHVDRTLSLIRGEGCKAGLVFNPATPLHYLDHVMDKVDLVLVMSVNPDSAARRSSFRARKGEGGARTHRAQRPGHLARGRRRREVRQHRRDRQRPGADTSWPGRRCSARRIARSDAQAAGGARHGLRPPTGSEDQLQWSITGLFPFLRPYVTARIAPWLAMAELALARSHCRPFPK